jgi:transcriptional regulator with XRE-family HTH domain
MFSDRIKKLRKIKKKTQQDIADLLGITRQAYGYYENGSRQPDFESLKKLSDYFGKSIDYLITGNENSHSPDEMWEEFLNPKTQIFFKDLKDAPEEKIEELIRFWEYIKQREDS